MQYLWKYVDELIGKGLEISIILEFLFYASLTLVSMAAPLAVLLSSLMVFGGLGEKYEIIAIKSAGIPLSKLFAPLVLLALIVACVTFWFSDYVSPKAYAKWRSLYHDISEQKPTLSIEEGTFYDGFDNYIIRVGAKGSDNKTIYDVLIYDHSKNNGNVTVTYAKKGIMQITEDKLYMLFTLYDGFFWDESSSNTSETRYPLTRAVFEEQYKKFDMSSFQFQKTEDDFYRSNNKALPIKSLKGMIDTLKNEINELNDYPANVFFGYLHHFNNTILDDTVFNPKTTSTPEISMSYFSPEKQMEIINSAHTTASGITNSVKFSYDEVKWRNSILCSYQIEVHRKFTMCVACLLFFFIGAPLGSIIRKGGLAIPLVVTVLFFTFYFAISIIGEKTASGNVIPPSVGMWFSTLILLPVCLFLSYKATIDSAVLSLDEYAKWIKNRRIFKYFTKKECPT